jgi:hypothetical protein
MVLLKVTVIITNDIKKDYIRFEWKANCNLPLA